MLSCKFAACPLCHEACGCVFVTQQAGSSLPVPAEAETLNLTKGDEDGPGRQRRAMTYQQSTPSPCTNLLTVTSLTAPTSETRFSQIRGTLIRHEQETNVQKIGILRKLNSMFKGPLGYKLGYSLYHRAKATALDVFQQQCQTLYLCPILPSLIYLQRAEEHSGMTAGLVDGTRNHHR